MKTCIGCNQNLPNENFQWKSKANNKRVSRCRECMVEYRRNYYLSGDQKEKQRKRVKERKAGLREQYRSWKAHQSCLVCGEDSTECLDLHHINQHEKEGEVSDIVNRSGSWKTIQREIDKCAVLCANCHRKVHSYRISLLPRLKNIIVGN